MPPIWYAPRFIAIVGDGVIHQHETYLLANIYIYIYAKSEIVSKQVQEAVMKKKMQILLYNV